MKYLKLEDIECYKISFELSNYVWDLVIQWKNFPKYTLGQQFVDAVDSISANIAEGFGRYSKKDKIRFYQIAKGSLLKSVDWNNKANNRKLLTSDQFNHITTELEKLPISINYLIKYTNDKLTI